MRYLLNFCYEGNGKVGLISNSYLINRNKIVIKTKIEKEMNQSKQIKLSIALSDSDLCFIYDKLFLFIKDNKCSMLDDACCYSIGKLHLDNKEYIFYDNEKFFSMLNEIENHLKEKHSNEFKNYLSHYAMATEEIYSGKKLCKVSKKKK